MNSCTPGTNGAGTSTGLGPWHRTGFERILDRNKTRQGYARERILKLAGYFFVRRVLAEQGLGGSASWQP
jgi:hypothetical protein